MVFTLEREDIDFEKISGGLPARPDYDFFRDKPGVKYLVGGRLDESRSEREEQMQFLQDGNAFVWKRYVPSGQKTTDSPFRIHWAIINGEVHWYRF